MAALTGRLALECSSLDGSAAGIRTARHRAPDLRCGRCGEAVAAATSSNIPRLGREINRVKSGIPSRCVNAGHNRPADDRTSGRRLHHHLDAPSSLPSNWSHPRAVSASGIRGVVTLPGSTVPSAIRWHTNGMSFATGTFPFHPPAPGANDHVPSSPPTGGFIVPKKQKRPSDDGPHKIPKARPDFHSSMAQTVILIILIGPWAKPLSSDRVILRHSNPHTASIPTPR
ncbi:hypothetical protein SAMN05421543_1402 [Alicyclobacillus macrosporangiidus]|uniref:Uncharacterized protein n=1 Tax=Alicyclobacillus macrosporangiidus TaxID=392015 RepID=A0A1I7LDV5_9BACL|nr:hypothetical protein SAMN05421543_1402 [Alicyclobacillus macrosporangiidus]